MYTFGTKNEVYKALAAEVEHIYVNGALRTVSNPGLQLSRT